MGRRGWLDLAQSAGVNLDSVTAEHVEGQNDCKNQEEQIKPNPGARPHGEDAVDEIGEPDQGDQKDILTLGGVEPFDQPHGEHPREEGP